MKRPGHLDPPAYLSKSPPVPDSGSASGGPPSDGPPDGEEHKLDPTRYGDWEKKGIAIDF